MTHDHAQLGSAPDLPRYPPMAGFPVATGTMLSFEYQLTREETVTAVRRLMLKRRRIRRSFTLAPLLIIVFGLGWLLSASPLSAFLVIASAMELAVTAWALIPGPGLAFRKSPSERCILEFYPDGIAVTCPQSYSRVAWRFYSTVEERADYYAIALARGQGQGAIVVPKRIFYSPMDEWRFRNLMRANLPTTFAMELGDPRR